VTQRSRILTRLRLYIRRNAVIAFLEFIAAHGQHGDATDAQKALLRYWKTDEATKPLLIVP
jgi:hypothetical protein